MTALMVTGGAFLLAGIAVATWRAITVAREIADTPPIGDDREGSR